MGADAAEHLAPQRVAVGLLLDTGDAREPFLHLLKQFFGDNGRMMVRYLEPLAFLLFSD